jgi:hypothetical protein
MPLLLFLLLLAGVVSVVLWPALVATAAREFLRNWPDVRETFVGRGSWVSFSRRFGRSYAIAALAIAFAWTAIGACLVPDTMVGVWLLFVPVVLLVVTGVVLGALAICRWIVDE